MIPPLALNGGWRADLSSRYGSAGRHYHTLQHVEEMWARWDEVAAGPGWRDPVAAWIAVALHDAVYVVGASDNEERSARLVAAWVHRWAREPVHVSRVEDLILETARHGDHGALDVDTALFVDCDMAILGAPPDRFAEYEEQVRREWLPVVGADGYAAGRRRFLSGLLGRRVFQSDWFHERLEDDAQRNLRAALESSQ